MDQTVGRDGQSLPALTGSLETAHCIPTMFPIMRLRWRLTHVCCILDFEMGIGDTMTLGKLGTQAERDRRMKKK